MCTDCGDFCLGSSALSVLAEGAQASRGVGTAGTQLRVWGDQPSRWWTGLESAGGTRWGALGRQGLGLLPSALQMHAVATGRSMAAHEAVCVEVLKTSAGLGLSLDGGKSSMAGDGPLLVKRVYKGNVLEKPVHCPVPVFSLCMSAPSIWKSNLFLMLSDIQGLLRQLCHEHFTRVAHPRDSYIAWVLLASLFYKRTK